jgi:hypothetical protein
MAKAVPTPEKYVNKKTLSSPAVWLENALEKHVPLGQFVLLLILASYAILKLPKQQPQPQPPYGLAL